MSKGARVRAGRDRAKLLQRRSLKRLVHFAAMERPRQPETADRECPVEYCRATGDDPCLTKSGAQSKRRHKGRAK